MSNLVLTIAGLSVIWWIVRELHESMMTFSDAARENEDAVRECQYLLSSEEVDVSVCTHRQLVLRELFTRGTIHALAIIGVVYVIWID